MKNIELQLNESQSGFRRGKKIRNNIFTIKQLLERAKKTSKNIIIVINYIEKAFGRVLKKAMNESLIQERKTI